MKSAENKAFTLVELLVVIAIIGILATLIVPAIQNAIRMAQKAKCVGNVKVIVQALNQYAGSAAQQSMPKVPCGTSNTRWNTKIGSNRKSSPFVNTTLERNHSANLWLLVRGEHAPLTAFVCPSAGDVVSMHQEPDDWDFAIGRYLSYGLQSPYGYGSLSINTPVDVVLVADGSPYVEGDDQTNPGKIDTHRSIVNWAGGAPLETKQQYGNSPNHRTQGQNVGFSDGSVTWRETADCGKNGDNIYSAAKRTDNNNGETHPRGFLNAGIRNNENDTVILP